MTASTDDPLFEIFRATWPRAAAEGETHLLEAWRGLEPVERLSAVLAIPAYLARAEEIGRRHLPSGSRYLSEKRWVYLTTAEPAVREGSA